MPRNPLDVLAQQIVAMTAMETWNVPDLFALIVDVVMLGVEVKAAAGAAAELRTSERQRAHQSATTAAAGPAAKANASASSSTRSDRECGTVIRRTVRQRRKVNRKTSRRPAPAGLWVLFQWAIEELNLGPHAYQACALTT